MRKAAYFVVMVIILLSCLATGCASKARPQLLSATGTTCTVRNNGPAGDVKVIFYQIPDPRHLRLFAYKQWVVFTLPEGEEITLEFRTIEDPSEVGRGRYYVSGPLPEDAHGGSKKANCELTMWGGGEITITKCGEILKEFQSPYCYYSGKVPRGGFAIPPWSCGFRVE